MDTMNEVISQVYLGGINAAKNSDRLKKLGINSILTIDMQPLPAQFTNDFKYKFIRALDSTTQNLFCYFDECCDFIEEACNNKDAIIVHCYVGVSRSATIVIAYLMRKYGLSLKDSCSKVTSKRLVSPNSGFMNQLKLYESLGCRIDTTDPSYRAYKLNQFAKNMIETFTDFTRDDIPINILGTDPSSSDEQDAAQLDKMYPIYRCKSCRRHLFFRDSLLTHVKGHGYLAYQNKGSESATRKSQTLSDKLAQIKILDADAESYFSKRNMSQRIDAIDHIISNRSIDHSITNGHVVDLTPNHTTPPPPSSCNGSYSGSNSPQNFVSIDHEPEYVAAQDHSESNGNQPRDEKNKEPEATCTDYLFIEPVAWMREQITTVQGKLHCPGCNSKLGSFNWAGERCGCHTWITPSFNIQRSKVDDFNPIKPLLAYPHIL